MTDNRSERLKFVAKKANELMKTGKSRKVAFKEASDMYKKKQRG